MRKAAIVTIGAGALIAAGSFLPALATQNPPPSQPGTPEPAYTNPCGSSALQYPVTPNQNTPIGPAEVNPPGGASGTSGIYGSNGYLELTGSAATQSGQISGELDDPSSGNNNVVYGSIGGSAQSGGNVCLGSSEAGNQPIVNQGIPPNA